MIYSGQVWLGYVRVAFIHICCFIYLSYMLCPLPLLSANCGGDLSTASVFCALPVRRSGKPPPLAFSTFIKIYNIIVFLLLYNVVYFSSSLCWLYIGYILQNAKNAKKHQKVVKFTKKSPSTLADRPPFGLYNFFKS